MRVNHAGEMAAQALYHAQALFARNAKVREFMLHAAREETDHLAWCETRLKELGARPSVLNPLWYAGSFGIGALAALLGDRASLGFVAETERQVEGHLKSHLEQLPPEDLRSRAIVEAMCHDEVGHGQRRKVPGLRRLPGACARIDAANGPDHDAYFVSIFRWGACDAGHCWSVLFCCAAAVSYVIRLNATAAGDRCKQQGRIRWKRRSNPSATFRQSTAF